MKPLQLCISTAVLLAAAAMPSRASSIAWTNSGGGNWNSPVNWNPNQVPGSNDTAVITAAGNYSVTLDVSPTVAGLVLGAGSGGATQSFFTAGQTLTGKGLIQVNAQGQFNFNGGTLAGAMTVASNSVLNLASGGVNSLFAGLVLTNYGTVNWTNTPLYGASGLNAQIYNYGLWNAQSDDGFVGGYNGGTTLFDNFGTFLKSGHTGVTTLDANVVFNNTGAANVESGTLILDGGGTSSGGAFATSGEGLLGFNDAVYNFTNTTTFSGIGIYLGGAGATFGGTMVGMLNWNSGYLSGIMTVASESVLNIVAGGGAFGGLVLTNKGTVNWTNTTLYGALGLNAQIYNYGVWNAQSDDGFVGDYNGGTTLFDNFGTFLKSGDAGVTTLDAGVLFNNTGAVNVESGTLILDGGGTSSGGSFTTSGDGLLGFTGAVYNFPNTTTFTGIGNYLGGGATFGGTIVGTLTWNGGLLSGVLTLPSNSVFNIANNQGLAFNGLVLTNYGTVNWTNTTLYGFNDNNAQIYNYGLWNAQSDDTFVGGENGGTTLFDNFGTFLKSGNAGATALDVNVVFNNTGTIHVQSGTLAISGGGSNSANGTFTASNGAVLDLNNMTFANAASLSSSGAVALGGNTTINGELTVPNLQLVSGALSGTFVLKGTLTWTGGLMEGVMTVASNSVFNISNYQGLAFSGLVLTNYGTVNWTNTTLYGFNGNNAQIYNYGLWNAQSDDTFVGGENGGTTLFDNFGTFLKSGNAGNSLLDAGIVFNNTGAVNVESGTLLVAGGGTSSGGDFTTASGGFLVFTGAVYDFTNSTTFTGTGSYLESGAVFGGAIAGTVTWYEGLLSGTLTLASNGILNISNYQGLAFNGLILTNYGTVNWTNTPLYGFYGNNAQIYNYGLWNAQSDDTFIGAYQGNTTLFDNFGTFRKSGNAGVTTLDAGVVFNNSGVLDAQSGTLSLGTYDLTGGTMNFGIGSLSNSAQIALAGNPATLDGALTAHFNNNFVPVLGNQFQILSCASLSGTFTSASAPGGVVVVYTNNGAFLLVTNPVVGPLVNWTQPTAITYGALLSSNQLNATANLPGTFAYAPTNGTFFTAGTHLLSVVFSPADTVHYSPESDTLSLLVLPAPLTITATNASMTYGGSVPALSLSYSGFVHSETPASLTTAPTFSTTGTSLSHAAIYPITVGGAVDTNYNIAYVAGTLTINPAPLTITASNASKTYGQTATLPATAFGSVGLLNGDTIASVTLTSAGATPAAGAAAYPIVPSTASGPRAGNYAITYNNGTLTVNKAPLTITATNESKYFGHAMVFAGTEFTNSGLQNGQTVGSVTLTSSGAVSTATVAGSPYPIVPTLATGGTFALTNYSITYVNGSLTVLAVGALPAISSVLPGASPNTGGTTVAITGTGFENGAVVKFASSSAASVTVQSATNLTAVTPPSSSGTVGVSVNNPDGNSVTNLNAFKFGNGPVITAQPTNLALIQGQTAQFQVQATGDATLVYQWQFNGAGLLEGSHTTGTKTATLTVNSVSPGDDGFYVCIITNLYESVSSTSAVLSVIVPPNSVAVSPASAASGAGGSVSFSVTASGTAPFGYFWYQNGSLLPGPSGSVLDIANVQASASYTVVVSNAAGFVTSAPVALTLLAYCASAQAAQAIYPEGTVSIPLSVQSFNCGSSAPMPNSPLALWIYTGGTSQSLPVTTDGSGHGTVLFAPLPAEVGLVQYGVALPGQGPPTATGSFTIIGMNLSAQAESPKLITGVPQTNTLLLNNLASVPLTGITATILGAPSDVNVQVSVPSSLPGNGSVPATYIVEATGATPPQAQFSIQFTSAEGATVTLPFSATLSPLTAQLSTSPASLAAAMLEGGQTLVSFTLTNSGGSASGPLQVNLPVGAPWLSVVTAQPIPSLASGQGGQIMLALTPTNGQLLGAYSGDLVVQGSNASVTAPFVFTAVSSLNGNLQVTAQDELSIYATNNPNLSNATVTVTDFLTGTNVGLQVTGSNGIVTFSNLTSAYYTVTAEAPEHGTSSTTLLVAAGTTTPLTAFLPLSLVDYTWTVTPTTMPDTYDFTLTTVFVTQVPWPVVIVTPGSIDLCQAAGDTSQVNLVITNAGLVAAEGLQLAFDQSNPNWSIVALSTNLGSLAAESSIVVPVTLTRMGSSTNAPTSIAAGVNWYVAALNRTEYNTTPIFIYNANPLNCEPSVGSSTPVALVVGGSTPGTGGAGVGEASGVGGGSSPRQPVVSQPSYTFPPPAGAVVAVTLQIDQTAVIAANAFHATLTLANNSGAQVTDLRVTINPVDAHGNPASNAFFIQPPLLSGVNAVDGTGSLGLGASAQANWTIIPTTNAAPLGTIPYAIGGAISYVLNGEQVTIPLFAVPITVLPDPQLYLDYFLQHDVYSQDPFTSVVEPPVPFALGLRVRNLGLGAANDFTITSSQPTIINNANGLLINFEIISSEVGASMTPVPSLTLNLGNINPGANVEGIWFMTSSLEGDFTNFQATFQHSDALGGLETSLVQGVKIHEMNHVVEIACPSDDGIPDFLCNDTTNVDALPDNVYSSDGNVYPVTSLAGAVSSGVVSGVNSSITVNDAADIIPAGFVYFQLPDPSGGQYAIASVKRSDGTELLVGPDVWQTPYRPNMVPPQLNNLIHIFDCNSTGSYTVSYGSPFAPPAATTLAAQNVTSTNATLMGTVNPGGVATKVYFEWGLTTNYGHFTPTNTLSADLNSTQTVTAYLDNLSPVTTIHYQVAAVNSAGTNYGGDQPFNTPVVPAPMITQIANQSLMAGQTLDLAISAVVASAPVTFKFGGSAPAGATLTADGVFSWTPTCAQGNATNVITIWATDSGTPPLSNSMSFSIAVGECVPAGVQLGIGSTVLQVLHSSSVSLTLLSSAGVTNLSFELAVAANQFTNWTFASSNSAIAGATMHAVGSSPPEFTLVTQAGQTLQSPSLLGTIGFTAQAGDSGFIRVTATNIIGLESGGGAVGNLVSLPGQVTVIGRHPLLAASLGGGSTRILTLFGNPGSNYQMAFSTNLGSTNWQPGANMLMTNLQQNLNVNQAAPQLFIRIQP